MMEFQVPKIVHEEVDEDRGIFVIEPLDRGFGYTFGNSLRRVLLSSLEGAAVTSVKIEGVAEDQQPTVPGRYDLVFMETRSRMTIEIEDAYLRYKGAPDPRAFRMPDADDYANQNRLDEACAD